MQMPGPCGSDATKVNLAKGSEGVMGAVRMTHELLGSYCCEFERFYRTVGPKAVNGTATSEGPFANTGPNAYPNGPYGFVVERVSERFTTADTVGRPNWVVLRMLVTARFDAGFTILQRHPSMTYVAVYVTTISRCRAVFLFRIE